MRFQNFHPNCIADRDQANDGRSTYHRLGIFVTLKNTFYCLYVLFVLQQTRIMRGAIEVSNFST